MISSAPHVLYVAWGFPPARTGGVYRALATANALAHQGFRVTVMTADEECWRKYTGADDSLLDQIDTRINILRVPFDWQVLNPNLYEYSWWRVKFPRLWNRANRRSTWKIFPENSYGVWRPLIEKAALDLHQSEPISAVIGTANPNVSFTPAVLLHEQYGIPYFVDHRDAWSLDVFDGNTVFSPESKEGKWEKRIFNGAEQIWFVNEPIANWHRHHYPQVAHKIHVVTNGWDPAFITPAVPNSGVHSPLIFGYLGTISGKVPIKEFVEAWKITKAQFPAMSESVVQIHGYLGFYGVANAALTNTLGRASEFGVEYKGPVNKTQIAKTYEQWDICLLILGTGRYVTSGKVFEYMATGKPIVSVHDPENAVTDVLKGYPLWFPVESLDPEEIARVLDRAAQAAQQATPEQHKMCINYAHQFRRDVVLNLAMRQVSKVVNSHQ